MQSLASIPIALIGGGNMARGLIGGLLRSGVPPGRITVATPRDEAHKALRHDFGVQVTSDNCAAARGAQIVILAVKPQEMPHVTRALASALPHRPVVISVAAGIRMADVRRWLGDASVPVIRAMPNRPALIGAGASGLYADASVNPEARALAEAVLASTGICVWAQNEPDLDVVTALSGSGPAYFFYLAELMAKAAEAQGLDKTVAYRLAAQTLVGAGRLVEAHPQPDLVRMCAEVASRGGTTEAALREFDARNLPQIVQTALDAAARRSHELGVEFGSK